MSNPFVARPSGGGDFPAGIEAGNYPAVMVAMVDLGVQENDYAGAISYRHEIYIAWEVHADGQVIVMGRQFALNVSAKSNLGKFVAALAKDGKIPEGEFDLTQLLGKPCLAQVSAKKSDKGDRIYNSIEGVSRMVKGLAAPTAKVTPVAVTLDEPIPEWLPRSFGVTLEDIRNLSEQKSKATAEKAAEWRRRGRQQKAAANPVAAAGGLPDDDESPF